MRNKDINFNADNAIDGNNNSYSKTTEGEGQYWAATFVSEPKKIGVDTIKIRITEEIALEDFG